MNQTIKREGGCLQIRKWMIPDLPESKMMSTWRQKHLNMLLFSMYRNDLVEGCFKFVLPPIAVVGKTVAGGKPNPCPLYPLCLCLWPLFLPPCSLSPTSCPPCSLPPYPHACFPLLPVPNIPSSPPCLFPSTAALLFWGSQQQPGPSPASAQPERSGSSSWLCCEKAGGTRAEAEGKVGRAWDGGEGTVMRVKGWECRLQVPPPSPSHGLPRACSAESPSPTPNESFQLGAGDSLSPFEPRDKELLHSST